MKPPSTTRLKIPTSISPQRNYISCLLILCANIILFSLPFSNTTPTCFYGWGLNSIEPSSPHNIQIPSPFGHGILHGKNISFIDAGLTHSVILDSEGNSYSFGSNSKGECAQGVTGGNIPHPRKVVAGTGFRQKRIRNCSAGYERTYFLDDEGQFYFVGVNDVIEVSPVTYNSPVGVAFPHRVSSISTSSISTLLLTENGEVYGFGNNEQGQLGRGTISRKEYTPAAVDTSGVLQGKRFTEVSAGGTHSLVLSSDGEVFSFGNNQSGQLGVGNIPGGATISPTPLKVESSGVLLGKVIVKISAGTTHSLVLSSDGEVFSFGSNNAGQLGTGNILQKISPVPVKVDTSGVLRDKVVTQISAGGAHSLVLSSEGQVYSFGNNQAGQLGVGNIPGGATISPIPLKVDTSGILPKPATTITQVSAGGFHSLILSSKGQVYSFGWNQDGELGLLDSNVPSVNTPTLVASGYPYYNLNITSISSTLHVLLREEEGDLLALGENNHGQVGDGSTVSPRDADTISVPFKVYQISAGFRHSLVLSSEGKVYSFGNDGYGQLGTGNTLTSSPTPFAVDTTGALKGNVITDISAGTMHSLLLSSDGEIFSFGNNQVGQLGVGNGLSGVPIPVEVETSGALYGKVIAQISAGGFHSLVLSVEGEVFAFGSNAMGQIGVGMTYQNVTVPFALSGVLPNVRVVQISAGTTHNLLLSSNSEVFSFGSNQAGQLGVGSLTPTVVPTPAKVLTSGVLYGKVITQVAAGHLHSLLLSSDGEIFSFGSNQEGQLGVGNSLSGGVTISPIPVRVDLSKVDSVPVKIFAGQSHSFLSSCHSRTCFGKDHLHPLVCSQRGQCISDDLCSCQEGYAPPACEYPLCNGKISTDPLVCSGKGNCTSPNHCECSDGHSGSDCETLLCFGIMSTNPSVCQSHGKCTAPNQCSCDKDYTGEICDVWDNCFRVAASDSENVCSGRGTCTHIDFCECNWMWSGRECESLSILFWLLMVTCSISALVVICLFGGTCSSVIVSVIALLRRVKRVEKEKKLTESLLHGFVRDTEMDSMDADSQRARLIVQKSMLEIDFSELSELQKIGSGGSGAILFRAKWNDSVVAVKVFKSGLMSGDTFFDEFEHEVSLMSTLRHRNVISFYGCSLAYPRIAIVMELCEAGSVETLIENGVLQRKSSHEILQMLLDIAEGMSFLHSREVIHRDLKCANVLVDEHGVCKLTDFGLSKYTKDQVEKSHTVGIGTSYYVAPELAKGVGEYDSSVDVYAFGILAVEMCLGRMCPFPAVNEDANNTAMNVQMKAIQDASYRPNVNELDHQYAFLQWILQLCWNENPKLRPPFRDIVKILRSSLYDTDQ